MGHRLLKGFIREALLVELGDAYGDVDYDSKDLARVFGDPQRVIRSIVGNTANIANSVRRVVSTVMHGLPSLVIPFVRTHYDEITNQSRRRQESIRRKYPEVFEPASKIFKGDALLTAFMISPVTMVSAYAGRSAPDVMLSLLEALGGKDGRVLSYTRRARASVTVNLETVMREAIDDDEEEIRSFGEPDAPKRPSGTGRSQDVTNVQDVIEDEGFKAALGSTPIVVDIQQEAKQDYDERLKRMISIARDVQGVTTVADIAKLVNTRPDVFRYFSQLDGDDKAQAETIVSGTTRRIMIDEIVKVLKDELTVYQREGVPNESGIYQAYGKALTRIQNISRESDLTRLTRPARRPRRVNVSRQQLKSRVDKQAPPEE